MGVRLAAMGYVNDFFASPPPDCITHLMSSHFLSGYRQAWVCSTYLPTSTNVQK